MMYEICFDVRKCNKEIKIKEQFGDKHIKVSNRCLLKDGKPWLPAMGECHFSRVPEEDWDKTLKLMKDGGISIVSTYLFWIHHEEIKGEFSFDGRCNLNKFIKKCDEYGLYVFLRPGPWVHGECRNGGFPDWLVEECKEACKDSDREWGGFEVGMRCLAEPYMSYVKSYLQKVIYEVKDNSNIIGIQIENELRKFPDYLSELKKIVIEAGINVPIYTATGWGKVVLNDDLIPTFGMYPDAGWSASMEDNISNNAYVFSEGAFSEVDIGTDIMDNTDVKKSVYAENNPYDMPYLTCEVGGGIQSTYHRRPLLLPEDMSAISLCTLGSGAAMLGIFMYKGGYNPVGKTTYMQESKVSGYPNDYPVISYDFQAPVGEACQVSRHYFLLKEIFEFCNNFGEMLAPMPALLPENMTRFEPEDKASVRCSVRSDGKSGFLFVNNHNRIQQLCKKDDVCFNITTAENVVEIPIKAVLPGVYFVMPFNFEYGQLKAKYITAMPNKKNGNILEFIKIEGIEPVLCKENGEVISLDKRQTIDGIDIVIREKTPYEISIGMPVEVETLKGNIKPYKCFEHLGIKDDTKEYQIIASESAKYVRINWMGNFAAAYGDGKLLCDRYYDGTPWIIDVSKMEKKEIVVKIQPFTKYDIETIYCNCERKEGHFVPSAEEFFDDLIYV